MDSWAANEKPVGIGGKGAARGLHLHWQWESPLDSTRPLVRSFQFRSRDRPYTREKERESERETEREKEETLARSRKISSARLSKSQWNVIIVQWVNFSLLFLFLPDRSVDLISLLLFTNENNQVRMKWILTVNYFMSFLVIIIRVLILPLV